MGVRGLQTFLERYCPSACYPVKISELAKKYKNETGNEPVIVIDAQSCYSLWYKGLDWVIGFEMQEFLYRLLKFIEAFKKIGIKIVFFFGGVTVEKKRKSWIGRRLRNIRDTFEIYDFLYKGNLTQNIPEKFSSLPPTMGLFTSMLLKYVLGCEVYMSIEECDEEIIEYAETNKCFAIFAQDSDFIVSDIKSIVLSAKNFNISDMSTLFYDREALAKILHIRVDQLPLLGVLAGNDLIDFENLKGFHCDISGIQFECCVKFDILMPALAKYIKNLPDKPIEQVLEYICIKIFGDTSQLDLVRSSYYGYFVQEIPKIVNPQTKWSRILQIARYRHRNTIVPSSIWGILKNHVFELAVVFEDLRRASNNQLRVNSFMPSAAVTRLLRQRMYGILLYEYEDLDNVKIEEWVGENLNSYQKPVLVKPVPPTVHHPGILQLWSDNNSDRHIEMKWKLFLSCVSPHITFLVDWTSLIEDLVPICASLYYLLEQKFLGGHEMNAVMATVATYSLYSREKLRDLYYGVPSLRCTHIYIGVTRTVAQMITLMAACGYPVPLSGDLIFMKFEAKLFQMKYKEMKQRRTVEEMCENNAKCIMIFNQMRRALSRANRKNSNHHDKDGATRRNEKRA